MNTHILEPQVLTLEGIDIPDQPATYAERLAASNCHRKNDGITEEKFPLTISAGPRALILIQFDQLITSQAVEEWAHLNGYGLARVDDLLALSSHSEYRELQLAWPIIQLGSVRRSGPVWSIPFLEDHGLCLLRVRWQNDSWPTHCRFVLSASM